MSLIFESMFVCWPFLDDRRIGVNLPERDSIVVVALLVQLNPISSLSSITGSLSLFHSAHLLFVGGLNWRTEEVKIVSSPESPGLQRINSIVGTSIDPSDLMS